MKPQNIIPEKVRDMLGSQDIEMVRLGVATLPEYVKNEQKWPDVLNLTVRKEFVWEIKNRQIFVRERRGLWEQIQKNNVYTYSTGKFTLEDIEKVIGEYFSKPTKE